MRKGYLVGILLAFLAAGCQQPTTTVTTDTNANTAANTNLSGANPANANTAINTNASNPTAVTSIEAREPEQYQAVVTIRLETQGVQNASTLPPVTANVARNGDNKRMEFVLPNDERIIYLDLPDKRLLVSPNREQYTELTEEALGVQLREMLTPAQIVERARNLKGVQQVGEEQYLGRTVIRYRYGAITDTKTEAGQVETESYVLVDKETGLPLRTETVSETVSGKEVQGIKGMRLVTEMTGINTSAPLDLFAEPTQYKKVPPQQVRQQVNAIAAAAAAIVGQLMKNAQQQPAGTPAGNAPKQ